MTEKTIAEKTIDSFAQLPLAPALLQVVAEIGYEIPTPIQVAAIPPLLAGRDLLGQAQTGTGKTAAFALPLLSRLDLSRKYPQLLVLAPTRELALQVAEEMQTYARHLPGFQVLPIYGGQNMAQQLRQLQRGVQAIVGTPGRIQDHLRRGTLKLDRLACVVVDEADEMLKMGFINEVEQILEHAPATRQVALFSATMPPEVLRIARRHLKDPIEIRIKSRTSTVETIAQYYWPVQGLHKLDALTRILEAEAIEGMLVFVRTKVATVELAEKLEARGFASAALNGDMTQALREKTVEQLKSGALDIVIATDVAARGLDVKRISHVINYDVPYDTESYVHRIGRTGRAGREGKAIIFVAPRERRMLAAIEQTTRQTITRMSLPTRREITDRRIELFKERIMAAIQEQELEFFEELIDNMAAECETDPRRLAAALAYLLQKERPLQTEEAAAEERPPAAEPAMTAPTARPGKARTPGGGRGEAGEMQTYRIEVGRQHGVEPGNIVGAITNEANLSNREIGAIKIHDEFSLVGLPPNLPPAVLRHLQSVWVCNRQLKIQAIGGPAGFAAAPPSRRPPFAKDKGEKGTRRFVAGSGPKSGKTPFKPRSGRKG